MKSIQILRHLPSRLTKMPCALTIGNFDGVHIGHQTMLEQVVQAAHARALCPTVMTFTPHPRAYFAQKLQRPEIIPQRINNLRDRLSGIASCGIEQIALLRFNEALAQMPAQTFVEKLLIEALQTKWLIVGADFRYGHRRSGDVDTLYQASRQYDFELKILDDVHNQAGERISSTRLRDALSSGDMVEAAALIGRPYRITGHVQHGRKLGRTLGFPTMNVRVPNASAIRHGIYVVKAHGLGSEPIAGIASLGLRPTVGDNTDILLETHLLDTNVDAYGKLVAIDLLQHVRDEVKFPDLPTLTAAMKDDYQAAVDYFVHHGL